MRLIFGMSLGGSLIGVFVGSRTYAEYALFPPEVIYAVIGFILGPMSYLISWLLLVAKRLPPEEDLAKMRWTVAAILALAWTYLALFALAKFHSGHVVPRWTYATALICAPAAWLTVFGLSPATKKYEDSKNA
jgi:hypothetical protein